MLLKGEGKIKTLPETALRFQASKDKIKTLENFNPEPRCGFRKSSALLCTKRFQCSVLYKLARSAGLCTRSSARALVGGLGAESPQGFAFNLKVSLKNKL
jgi:hypothetical protein